MGTCPMRPRCSHYDQQAVKVTSLLAAGHGYDAVRAAFVEEFGSQAVLAAPIDEGFNRAAWALPYLLGVLMLAAIVVTARRWARRAVRPPAAPSLDTILQARLDDELRDLD